jgi:hypothetical protein
MDRNANECTLFFYLIHKLKQKPPIARCVNNACEKSIHR